MIGPLNIDAPARPALRYYGGKWVLGPWIISHLPEHRVYVEPYGGGASVLLRKKRSYAEIYNDLDGEVVNLFRVLRDSELSVWLRRQIRLTPFSRLEFIASYEPSIDPVEQARRTIVRSYMGFGSTAATGNRSGFRANSNRSGSTPAHDWANYPAAIEKLTDRLSGVVIESRPAAAVMKAHDSLQTLHYVDPPYPHSTRALGNPYCRKGYRFEMSDDDHRELAAVLRSLKGMVVLSGYECDLYSELYSDWECRRRASFADGARSRVECLWLSPNVSSAIASTFRFEEAV